MIKTEDFEKVPVESAEDLRAWLESNHGRERGVWVVTYKKQVPEKYVTTGEVLDELLAFGWIDGIRRKLDEERTMQLITPRRAQHWSKTYKDRVAKLEAEGRMAAPGRAAVAAGKASGLWNFLDDVDALVQPPDLVAAFADFPGSRARFEAFGPATQRFALRWIKLAKTDKTRRKRVRETARLAQLGQKVPGS